MSDGTAIFSRKQLVPWVLAAVTVFAIALYLMAHGDVDSQSAVGPTVQSQSALGYAGIADVMEQIGTPVVHSRAHGPDKATGGGVLVIAEPHLENGGTLAAQRLLQSKAVLLILPKWEGAASKGHSGWIQNAELPSIIFGQLAVDLVDPDAQIVRGPPIAKWDRNAIGITPIVAAPLQIIRSRRLKPIVANGKDILVGELDTNGRRLFVLTDPDVMSNHSLSNPINASFGVALIGALRTGDGPVVFDESLNGAVASGPNILNYLFKPPLLPGTILALLAAALLLWATMPRFGVPDVPAPALQSGKGGLIDNIAALIGFAGRRGAIVGRFVDATVQDVARRLHAPRGLAGEALSAWLDRVGGARNVDVACAALVDRANALSSGRPGPALLISLARDTNRWKREMIDGSGRNQSNR
jgi:hypothetical protein